MILSQSIDIVFGQTNAADDHSTDSIPIQFAEKIYLQLNGKVYTRGNVIWFKSIVLSAKNHLPSTLSGILYVELVDSDETILDKKLIKLDHGIGQGFFDLYESYPPGTYLVRAYTNWDKNFGADFFFKEYIQVFTEESHQQNPINEIKLIKETQHEQRLTASFHPLEIDSLHEDKLKVLVTLDDRVDSLYLKKDKNNIYHLDYDFYDKSQFAKLEMQTENDEIYESTIVLDPDSFDLQFLPESGELVHGISSKVGYKAVDAKGKGKWIEGDIVDENDSLLLSFKSNSLGMGSFILNDPDSTKKYYARIKSTNTENPTLMYPLPKVAQLGNTLSVEKQGENILLNAQSNYLKNDSIYVAISCRGERLYNIKGGLTYFGSFKLTIPYRKLPDGIILFTMMDNSGQPVAERLYFNENPESGIKLKLSVDKKAYEKRDETQLSIDHRSQRKSHPGQLVCVSHQ
ncbi:MAG: hypothetical protein ACFHWX_18145 [Bacteroidota bacterium]